MYSVEFYSSKIERITSHGRRAGIPIFKSVFGTFKAGSNKRDLCVTFWDLFWAEKSKCKLMCCFEIGTLVPLVVLYGSPPGVLATLTTNTNRLGSIAHF